jgi:hypothetical protein
LFTSGPTYLDEGDYIFEATVPFSIGTFDYGDYAVNWDETHDEWTEINAGKVTVSKEGNIYEITIDCTDENGLDIPMRTDWILPGIIKAPCLTMIMNKGND